MKIAILTSLCGTKQTLSDPSIYFDDVDYFAFVEKSIESKIWKQKSTFDFTFDNQFKGRRNAKIYKIIPNLFLPDYDYWFWVDATHEVMQHPKKIIEKYFTQDEDVALWKHTTRNCAYQEAEEIKKVNYDNHDYINNQIQFYKNERFPQNNNLYELSVNIRKNTKRICELNLMWFEQICRFSSRDQVSMPYVLWKKNIQPIILPGFANGGLYGNDIMPQVRHKLY